MITEQAGFKNLAELLKVAAVAVSLVVTGYTGVRVVHGFVATQEAQARDISSITARMEVFEEAMADADLDDFRLSRNEQDLADIKSKVDEIARGQADLRVLVERALVQGGR